MQLAGWTNALAQVTTFGYDPLGNLTNVTDARSNPLAFGYNAVGRDSSPAILPGRPHSLAVAGPTWRVGNYQVPIILLDSVWHSWYGRDGSFFDIRETSDRQRGEGRDGSRAGCPTIREG
jgi:YD repeat-containing protein